ncbi:MAG: hypothetical protein JSU04_02615 [Bdellovibrionales bacterium]|nr:hypothetical protein [Bdellovibrionales bacterium]
MNKLVLLKILVMVMALYMVLYAMRELRQPSGMMRANSNNPIFLLFGASNK